MMNSNEMWDYIIVGGGSAGCTVASELSRDATVRVLLLEAGRDTPPGGEPAETLDPYYARAMQKENFWPEMKVRWTEDPNRASMFYEQARILGGGSSVNSMVAVRAVPADFSSWTDLGLKGWSWDDILPFYKEIESDTDFPNDAAHGSMGPIPIRRHTVEQWPKFCKTVSAAAELEGLPLFEDINADFRDGVSRVPMNNTSERRVSSAAAFLDETVRRRPNLRVQTGTRALRVIIKDATATGVEVESNETRKTFHALNVILSAGTIWSPTILQHSGIGDGAKLKALGIDVVADIPAVGQNLQEHPTASLATYLKPHATQKAILRSHANAALRITSKQPFATGADVYCAVFAKSSWHSLGRRIGSILLSLHSPYSRGEVRLSSPESGTYPDIDFRVFSDERDLPRMVEGLRFAMGLLKTDEVRSSYFGQPFLAAYSPFVQSLNRYSNWNAFRSFTAKTLLDALPWARPKLVDLLLASNVDANAILSDDCTIGKWLRENATGFFHPVGTCAMGPASSPSAVVDECGGVHGISGLHVIDASIMPIIPRANTNITTITIALKIARELRFRPR